MFMALMIWAIDSFFLRQLNLLFSHDYIFRFIPSEIDRHGYDIALIRLPRLVVTYRDDPKEQVLPICLPWTTKEQVLIAESSPSEKYILHCGNPYKYFVISYKQRHLSS